MRLTLLELLAQSGPATQAVDLAKWEPDGHQLLMGILAAGGTLIAGILVLYFLRDVLQRLKLGAAVVVATLACALYAGLWGMKYERMIIPSDPLTWWITRAFAAVMAYVALRLVDRLGIVPLLTRRGTVAMPRFFHQMVVIVLSLFVVLIYGANAFGWDISGFLAGSAVVSIVLGLALQESLGNFFSGLVMQASPPFAIGDWIVCGDHEGRVVDMTWRAVTLHTLDDNFILIPNATIAKADITNFHAPTVSTARTIKIGLESDVPPADAIAILKASALETAGVLAQPEPLVFLGEYADTSVNYVLKFWIREPAQHVKIEHQVRVHTWYRLRERGIEIPNPRYVVEHVHQAHKLRRLQEAATERFVWAIEHVPLLQPLSREQKVQLAASANDVMLATGQVLFQQNDAGDSFYVISEGQVDVLVTRDGDKESRKVATLGPGEFFGEMSALTGQPRTATIRAAAPLVLVKIEKQDLLAIFKADPSIMEKVSEIVARRNAEREAVLRGAGAQPATETVAQEKRTLLGRMMKFFRLGNAA
jgi:small-conductance mechanosensitive channel/CRP-like cAMP-binding protein